MVGKLQISKKEFSPKYFFSRLLLYVYFYKVIIKYHCFEVLKVEGMLGHKGEHITHLHISDIVTFETDITDTYLY